MGFLIYSADGSSWDDYVAHPATRQELNLLNLSWTDCKSQLEQEGEQSIYTDLSVLDEEYDMTLIFWLSLVRTESELNDKRAEAFLVLNEKLGHSEDDIEHRVKKLEAMINTFGL